MELVPSWSSRTKPWLGKEPKQQVVQKLDFLTDVIICTVLMQDQ